MKYKELTTKSETEARRMLEELKLEKIELTQKIKLAQEKQNHKLKAVKQDIARIMTYLRTKVS